uniref:Tuftelin-like n=1 Tax=Cynoglossus semilaevis TaxID=244447 RepID=A0A3P8VDU2_CYNSE
MLTDEVPQIQEVRYCLKTLREQMAARQNSNNKVQILRVNALCHFQKENDEYHTRLVEQSERLQRAEDQSEEKCLQVEELQRLLGGMELESSVLRDKMAEGEAELLQLRVASLKEKIHHLDDMLKSQQRKVRHMIEQVSLQNSRTVIQERDRVIGDLEEKVAFLEAEVRNHYVLSPALLISTVTC